MPTMQIYDAIIIGAGPAGMMAAINAAENKKKILLIERNNNLGAKLLITGGGRCNITNICDAQDFLKNFSSSRDFLRNSFAQFFNTGLLSFFEESGVLFKTEMKGCVFPVSDKSIDILNVLKRKLGNNNVEISLGERVRDIIVKNKSIEGIVTFSNKYFLAKNVVIATGGLSYPQTGSTGDGYKFSKKLGHTIVALKPALVPIIINEKPIKDWQGISFQKVRVTVLSNDKKVAESSGGLVFTHFGVSGPTIFDVSAAVCDSLELKNNVKLIVNFVPEFDRKGLDDLVLRELKMHSAKVVKNMFNEILPKRMMKGFLKHCGIDPEVHAHQMTIEERKKLISGLSGLCLTPERVLPVKDGLITRGGISTKEINPKTMESKFIKGLFFAGEVIDVDATTGGYNLQAAFSTGWVCGTNI